MSKQTRNSFRSEIDNIYAITRQVVGAIAALLFILACIVSLPSMVWVNGALGALALNEYGFLSDSQVPVAKYVIGTLCMFLLGCIAGVTTYFEQGERSMGTFLSYVFSYGVGGVFMMLAVVGLVVLLAKWCGVW